MSKGELGPGALDGTQPAHPPMHAVVIAQPGTNSMRCRGRASLALALVLGFVLLGLWDTGPLGDDPWPPVSPDCVMGLGGGPALKGGSFPTIKHEACKPQLDAYFSEVVGQYYAQVAAVASQAIDYVKGLQATTPPSRDQLFVFDIDETVLSNKVEWTSPAARSGIAWLGRAGHPGSHCSRETPLHPPVPVAPAWSEARGTLPILMQGVAAVDETTEDFLAGAERPPLVAVRQLYLYLLSQNYSVALITGRRESGRAFTAHNLKTAGFGSLCSKDDHPHSRAPCYVALHLREETDDRPASVYKPERRKQLQDAGYTLIGNIGDQFSDIEGLHQAASSWKLPNPIYYIL